MRLDFQSGKVVLSYKKMYFDNAYCIDGMYNISTNYPHQLSMKSLILHTPLLYDTTD